MKVLSLKLIGLHSSLLNRREWRKRNGDIDRLVDKRCFKRTDVTKNLIWAKTKTEKVHDIQREVKNRSLQVFLFAIEIEEQKP